ncbi:MULTISPECIES: hypothetical protein [unclassified Carboxylicivirga]|uniref:hypothetical protein n=1 Tax=Carboxylicivirga TaxID=1628153 RepID=UPI003D3478D7
MKDIDMEQGSGLRAMGQGIIVALCILVLGYVLNPFFGAVGLARLSWPNNLYLLILMVAIGLIVGFVYRSPLLNWMARGYFVTTLSGILGLGALTVFIWPSGVTNSVVQELLMTPFFLLLVIVYFIGGIYFARNIVQIKHRWTRLLMLIALLGFSYSTVASQRDYYSLNMRIGSERALFEADDAYGSYYRLPFAIKLLADEEVTSKNTEEQVIRFFKTVSDYEDVRMAANDEYRLKGWKVKISSDQPGVLQEKKLVDLDLVFDRWMELKYISLLVLLVALLLRVKY